jgi:hypothetical protein
MVTAQLGSGTSRSPFLPDFVDGSRGKPNPGTPIQPPTHIHLARVKVDLRPTDGQALTSATTGSQHHQHQVQQVPVHLDIEMDDLDASKCTSRAWSLIG